MRAIHSVETIDTIRRMWDAGMTTAAIGRQSGMSKNKVIGISYRNDFPKRGGAAQQSRSRPVITPRGTFPSVRAATRAFGISHSTGQGRAKRHFMGWRFVDDRP